MMVRENVFSITDSYLFRFILLGLQERLGKIFDMTLCRSCLFSVCYVFGVIVKWGINGEDGENFVIFIWIYLFRRIIIERHLS